MSEETKPTKLAFMIPAYNGALDMGHANMWLEMGAQLVLRQEEFQLIAMSGGSMNPVAKIRNAFVESALECNADWLIMIDADTFTSEPDKLLDMIAEGVKHDIAVMSAVVLSRAEGHTCTVFIKDPKLGMFRACTDEVLKDGDGLTEVDRCGAAMLAINLGWIRKEWPVGPWFVHDPPSMGEDWTFCFGVHCRGGRIVADGRVPTSHVRGRQLVDWNA